ncbi:unnamed protein product [Lactuca saligna]|uniref:Uncharacterized protein n=1 Tax=Lactuca saligna TaxID=75948 RepID=A0AA35Z1V0_LACSI|nr:unnamed protein product [Lactuca saligna]
MWFYFRTAFHLKQSSAENDSITGNQDIQIRENINASSLGSANQTSHSSSERDVRPDPNDNLDSFLSFSPASTQERREKKIRVEQLKGKMLVMKHSNQNAPGDHPEMFFSKTGKKFIDKYGDCSSIMMWGYDAEKKMWIIKQKSGRIEYYEKKVDFFSWKFFCSF